MVARDACGPERGGARAHRRHPAAAADLLRDHAATRGDKPFIVAVDQDGRSVTFRQLWRLSNRMARFLADRNIGPGGRIAVGARRNDPGMERNDDLAQRDELNDALTTLEPFLIARTEMTVAQFARLEAAVAPDLDPLLPVTDVDWFTAQRALGPLQRHEQIFSRQRRLQRDYGIHEIGLLDGPERCRSIQRRPSGDTASRDLVERCHRPLDLGLGIIQVAAQSNVSKSGPLAPHDVFRDRGRRRRRPRRPRGLPLTWKLSRRCSADSDCTRVQNSAFARSNWPDSASSIIKS